MKEHLEFSRALLHSEVTQAGLATPTQQLSGVFEEPTYLRAAKQAHLSTINNKPCSYFVRFSSCAGASCTKVNSVYLHLCCVSFMKSVSVSLFGSQSLTRVREEPYMQQLVHKQATPLFPKAIIMTKLTTGSAEVPEPRGIKNG